MCGIAGILVSNPSSESFKTSGGLGTLKKMTDALHHRGPDGEGAWTNAEGSVFLGHRRLSVLDPSPAAAQPMHFTTEHATERDRGIPRYTIVHNGEIYNYIELRTSLQKIGYSFKTGSDAELILAAYDHWKEKCLQQFEGMFSFAIWDQKAGELFAARDRFGEKPFYYFEEDGHFIFASEMKALWAVGVPKRADGKMLLNYLTLGHVQNSTDKEQCFFEKIWSLPPSHYLKFSLRDNHSRIHRYWGINRETRVNISADEAIQRFTGLLNDSIKKRLQSDVEIGASISGGLDSSAIVAILHGQRPENFPHLQAGKKLKTFSAVFPGFERNESGYISRVTERFGLDNFQVVPTADNLVKDFEKLCFHQEEPFSSSGIYAQYKVFELARQHGVKVILDGQGADEILAGYPKYIHWYLQEVLNRHKLGAVQKEKKALLKNDQHFDWNVKTILAAFLPAHAAIRLEKKEYVQTIKHPDIERSFVRSMSGRDWEGIHKPIVTKLNDILYFNTMEMGLEELLRFADRNSMAHGLETRLPFLDHRLVEFVFSLPSRLKIHNGWTKWMLRQAMEQRLPGEIVWRKEKTGFEPPQLKWMKEPLLQDYMHEAKRKLVGRGILKRQSLDKKIIPLDAYAPGNYDWRYLCAAQII